MKAAARLFLLGLRVAAAGVRTPGVHRVARRLLGATGAALARRAKIGTQGTPREMAEAWQRAFPSRKQVPIVASDDTTAYAEIRTVCPLRGTGDVEACWRMMQYDRSFAARAGAQFVVLASQASPGVEVCKVALRAADLPADDLVPAHRLRR